MKTPVTLTDIKDWLRLPLADDADLDPRLSAMLIAAAEGIQDSTGFVLIIDDDVDFDGPSILEPIPERINMAIKFQVASWYENPSPSPDQQLAAQQTVDNLISRYKVFTYPE